MDDLNAGDLVLIIGMPPHPFPWCKHPGSIGTVSDRCACAVNGQNAKRVEFSQGIGHCYPRHCLRKLEPPKDDVEADLAAVRTTIEELQE